MADDSSDTLNTTQAGSSKLEVQLKLMIASECAQRYSNDGDYDNLPADKKALVLLIIGANSEASEELRSFSLDRLSALLTEVVHNWSSEILAPFNDELIKCLLMEANDSITEKMGEILVKVALQSYYLNSEIQVYSSITDFVRNCVRNGSSSLKKVALALMKRVPNLFGITHITNLKDVFESALRDGDKAIRIAAAQTFFSVVHKDTIAVLSSLLTYIIQICEEFVRECDTSPSSFCPLGSLFKLASEYARILWPHLKDVIRLCSRATPELGVDQREALTGVLARVIRGRDNDDIDADSCAEIAHFIVNYCAPARNKDIATLAMKVVSDVPHGFKDARAVLHLISTRLADDYSILRIETLNAMMRLINTHDEPNYHSILLPPLLPQIIKLCTDQVQSENDYGLSFYTPMYCLWKIAMVNAKLLESIVFPILALSPKILRKASSEKGQHLAASTTTEMRQLLDILEKILFDCKTRVTTNSDSEKETISELCQQLSKASLFISFYVAYSENVTTMRDKIMVVIRRVAMFLGALEITGAWSVHNEIMKNLTSDHYITVTLHIIRWTPAFSTCSVTASSFFALCFSHPDESIKLLALEVFSDHCSSLKRKKRLESLKQLSHLVPHVLMLCNNYSSLSKAARECLFGLSALSADILQPHLTQLVHFVCQMIGDPSTSVYWRQQFSHFITHLTRKFDLANEIDPSMIPLIYSTCISTMTEIDDNVVGWEARDDYLIGSEQRFVNEDDLVQLVFCFKEKGAGKTLLQLTSPLLNHVDWKQRNAGAIGLAAIGCVTTAETVTEVVNRILSLLQDSNNRVRSTACFALTRFFVYCPPHLLEMSHAIVIPALLTALKDTRVPQVTAAAAAALAACCKIFPKSVLRDHLSAIVQSAVVVIEKTYRSLLTDGKTCILAQVLDAASLECISLISLAVGEKKCSSDCTEIMTVLLPRIDSILLLWEGDFSSSFGRMASSMGNSFLPFLRPLMKTIIDTIRTSRAQLDDEGRVVHVYGDDPILRRKKAACAIAVKLPTAVGAAFLPYTSELSHLALAHLEKTLYNKIYINNRQWSLDMIPALIEWYKASCDIDAMNTLWYCFGRLFADVVKEEQWGGMIIPSIARCVQSIATMTEVERLFIGDLLKKERDSLRERRQQTEEAFKNHVKYEDSREVEKEDDNLECTMATLECALKKFD